MYDFCLSIVIATIVFAGRAEPFSFNEAARTVFAPGIYTNNHSYFGYSLVLRGGATGQKPLIVVGAPRERSHYLGHNNINDPGAIYMCEIDTNIPKSTCSQKILDTEGNTRHVLANGKSYHHRKDNMWLGMAVQGTTSHNGSVVMCAPRWINQFNTDYYLANGLCYTLASTDKTSADVLQLIPLVDKFNQGFQSAERDTSNYFYAYGQAGLSVKMSDDGSEIIMGAPGVFVWSGSIVRYSRGYARRSFSRQSYTRRNIPNPYYTPELTDSSYFGYSVDSGNFISGRTNLYVAGAPRGADYKGQVLLFDFPLRDSGRYIVFAILEGHQLGEYFGSTLAAVDINQDGLSDLIVGAPMYAKKHNSDQGRVYVYMNHDKANLIEQEATIGGRLQSGARFGSSISAIGDINNDGFMDVAIGAPYEDNGKGAVYIYLGAANGLNPNYTQRITMDDMRGFGISISRGVDIDRNSCNDIAIGAHDSANVVLLRCHPSIDVTTTIEAFPSELSLESTNFTAKICHTFSGSTSFATEINVNLSVDLEYKSASLETPNDATYVAPGYDGETYCKEAVIIIDSQQNNDFSRPIDIQMTFDLKENPLSDSMFCANCVVLRPSSKKETSLRVPFASGCGDDLVCQPDLKLSVEVLNKLPFIIGSSPSLAVNISVKNVGEPAFLSRVELRPPAAAPLLRVPHHCHLVDSLLSCDFHNPLATGAQGFVVIELDVSSLTSFHSLLMFNITAISGGDEETPEDNIQTLEIQLKTEAQVLVVGEAAGDTYVYINPSLRKRSNVTILHTYEILNEGPTSLDMFHMKYFIPVAYLDPKTKVNYTLINVFEPVDRLNQAPFFCNAENGNFYIDESLWKPFDFENTSNASGQNRSESEVTQESIAYTEGPQVNGNEDLFSLEVFGSHEKIELPKAREVRTTGGMYLNCSDTVQVTCLVVNCVKSGGLPAGGNGAHMLFKMKLNISNIEKVINQEGSMIISTYGAGLQPKNVVGFTSTLVVGSAPPAPPTPIWIYIVAVIGGILLLALISYILYKLNFFHRKTKEDLHLLKNQETNHTDPATDSTDEDI